MQTAAVLATTTVFYPYHNRETPKNTQGATENCQMWVKFMKWRREVNFLTTWQSPYDVDDHIHHILRE